MLSLYTCLVLAIPLPIGFLSTRSPMPSFRSVLFFLQLAALWLAIIALAGITAIAFIGSTNCANCELAFGDQNSTSHTGFYVTDRNAQTTPEQISAFVYKHNSYFQSIHITLFQAVTTCCLAISTPSLWAMIWSRLDHSTDATRKQTTTTQLQSGIDVAQSMDLKSAFLYIMKSRSVPYPVFFVILVAILSRIAPIAISPIYKPHDGPYIVNAVVSVGGGVGISTYGLLYTWDDIVPGGLESGRALIGARSYLKSNIAPTVYDIGVAPFLYQGTIQAIWNAQIKTAVARNTLDCGTSAPRRFWNSSGDLVVLDPNFFTPNVLSHELEFSIAGHTFPGQLTNEPLVSSLYLGTSVTNATGTVTAVTSVAFLAANGTFEGSQQSITSPQPTSRIESVDVLVCTSNTTLEVDYCTINQGRVVNCSPSNTDDLSDYIAHPNVVAIILAASPVTAYYHLGALLPIYAINEGQISSQLPPLPYLTTTAQTNLYNIPLNYTQNVLFKQTAQGIVQGMINAFPVQQSQTLQITVTFATSQPILLYVIMALAFACGAAASRMNTSLRNFPAIDATMLLALSRDQEFIALSNDRTEGDSELTPAPNPEDRGLVQSAPVLEEEHLEPKEESQHHLVLETGSQIAIPMVVGVAVALVSAT